MSGFKTKARTVELLGRKQIRDSVTALAELMKNAYDADAPWLRVEFSTTGSNQHWSGCIYLPLVIFVQPPVIVGDG